MSLKQLETTQKVIGDYNFYIRPFPAFTAARISGELAAVLSPLFGSLAPLAAGDNSDDILTMDVEKALPAVSNAFSGLSGPKFEALMRELLIDSGNVSVEGEATEGKTMKLTYDLANEVFCGEVQDMYILCFEVIRLNFQGFFKKIGDRFGNLQGFIQKLSPTSNDTEPST